MEEDMLNRFKFNPIAIPSSAIVEILYRLKISPK